MRKFAFVFPAVFLMLLFTLSAQAQSSASADTADTVEKPSRYDFFGGVAVTSQNQLVHAHGFLLGFQLGATRNWGKYFGINAQVSNMALSLSSKNQDVTGISPSYTQVLVGPELHATLYERVSGGVHILVGISHTGGSGFVGTPDISVSNDLGAYLQYKFTPRFSLRLGGDRVATSFVEGAANLGYSPHRYSNVQSSLGVVYHF
jgi:hypothetical protein